MTEVISQQEFNKHMVPSRILPFTYNDPLNPLYSCTVTPFQPDESTLQWHWSVQRTDTGKILEQSDTPLPCKTDALARGLGAMTRCIIHRRS